MKLKFTTNEFLAKLNENFDKIVLASDGREVSSDIIACILRVDESEVDFHLTQSGICPHEKIESDPTTH